MRTPIIFQGLRQENITNESTLVDVGEYTFNTEMLERSEDEMMLPVLTALAGVLASFGSPPAGEKPAETPATDYVRLTAEVRGTLRVEKDTVTVRVLLGGSCLLAFYDTWELDFGKNDELKTTAVRLNGETVLVNGVAGRSLLGFGAKTQEPRQIIAVKTITKAPAK